MHEDMESGSIAPPFLTSALDGGEWSHLCCCYVFPGEGAYSTHWVGGWMSSRAGMDAVEKRKIFRYSLFIPEILHCSGYALPHNFLDLDPVTIAVWLASFNLIILNIFHRTMTCASSLHNNMDYE
jgi:hypothetical protein